MIKKGLKDTGIFISSELSLVAALVAWNFPIHSIDKSEFKKVSFIFQKTPELSRAVEAFWNETDYIAPKKYFYALREVKSRIYGGQL